MIISSLAVVKLAVSGSDDESEHCQRLDTHTRLVLKDDCQGLSFLFFCGCFLTGTSMIVLEFLLELVLCRCVLWLSLHVQLVILVCSASCGPLTVSVSLPAVLTFFQN